MKGTETSLQNSHCKNWGIILEDKRIKLEARKKEKKMEPEYSGAHL